MATDSSLAPGDGRSLRAKRLRAERRTQVLDCAQQLFAEKGYHATSIDDIISSANIARGTFYLYFQNKRAIFEELLDNFLVRVTATIQRIQVAEGSAAPIQQMYDNVARLFARLGEDRAMTTILIRQAEGFDDDFDRKLTDFYQKLHVMIRNGLTLGMHMGLVRTCNAEIVAHCVLGSVREVARELVRPSGDAKDVDFRMELARETLNYNLLGTFRAP